MTTAVDVPPVTPGQHDLLTVVVTTRHEPARDIVALDLSAPDGGLLPPWDPGAHIEVRLAGPDGQELIRHYSLCGDPHDRTTYRIAVLADPAGRGGSVHIHRTLRPGSELRISVPRNHFPLADADRYVFVAGGIGITPILAMARAASAAGRAWRAYYLVRERDRLAFADDLSALGPTTVWVDAEHGRFDLDALIAGLEPGTELYACGPTALLDELERRHTPDAAWGLHFERFSAAPVDTDGDTAFEVVAARSGTTCTVEPGCSVLAALRSHGISVPSSCGEGVCGTCETTVLEGVPDHRDAVLTEEERAANETMMICVSRAKSARLVLDI